MTENSNPIDNLSPEKRALLILQLKKKRLDADRQGDKIIVPVPRGQKLQASIKQEVRWARQRNISGRPLNTGGAFRISGSLDLTALQAALNAMIQRHESLRTNFTLEENILYQTISPTRQLEINMIDLQTLSPENQENEVKRNIDMAVLHDFDQSQEMLVYSVLLHLASHEFVFILVLDHIISDGWSRSLFLHELSELYKAFSTGQPVSLPDMPIQYADFACWERQQLEGDRLKTLLSYWRAHLDNRLPRFELPMDLPRPLVQHTRGASRKLHIPSNLTELLRKLSYEQDCTHFMTLLAAFTTLLYKCSQSDCINVLSPSANRTRPETKGLIGDFAHQVLFHVNFAGDPEFRELLQQVKRVVLDANTHQDLPFRDLMARLFPDQVAKVGKTSFMQQLTGICFSYDKAEEDELRLYNLNVQPIVSEEVTAILDLTFSVTEDQKGLHLTAIYRDDLFHASTIDRMLEQYETILRKIVSNPKASLSVLLTG